MDTDLLIENRECLYGDDFLDHLTKEYQWSSLLDVTDASPSEILADAAPVLVPPISPVLSIKSSPPESSNSDSGSEDDSKNSSSGTSERQSSQSPVDWMSSFEDDPPYNLNLEDVEQFLQKNVSISGLTKVDLPKESSLKRNGPVVAIENGVIKGAGIDNIKGDSDQPLKLSPQNIKVKGNGQLQNSYFKVENENYLLSNLPRENKKIVLNEQIQLVVEQKKIPNIMKRPNLVISSKPSLVIPADSTKGGKIAISPLPNIKVNNVKDCNGSQLQKSSPRNSLVISPKPIVHNPTTIVQHGILPVTKLEEPESPISPTLDISNLSEAEIRALKKQQRMIKNRESACQSRQKKKEYVTALEQQLLEAHQEIARLRLENKLLRDQLDTGGRSRKIPRLDASLLIPKKNIAVIFVMVFMVSLNFNVLGWNNKPFVGSPTPHRSMRHLLWSEENADTIVPDFDQPVNHSNYGTDCQNVTMEPNDFINMNQTESIRIVGELNRWIGSGKTLNWTDHVMRRKRKDYLSDEKINGGLLEAYRLFNKLNLDGNVINGNKKNIKEKTHLRRLRKNKELDFSDNIVYDYEPLYPNPIRKSVDDFDMGDFGEWNALLQALQRRDDTFYVVGVGKGEHLLLPAVSHNVTRPPKMALILPAKSGNDSFMNDHVTLMQIDCSIVNTSLVKLKSDTLPGSLRKKTNVHNKPENNPKSYSNPKHVLRKSNVNNNDDNFGQVLQNSSNNVGNYPIKFEDMQIKDIDVRKDILFTQHLMSKYKWRSNNSHEQFPEIINNKSKVKDNNPN